MILLSEIRLLQKQYILKALPVKAVNGQDERRISCAAIDSPARSCSAVIKAGKPQGCLPASFDFEWRSVAEIGLKLRPISTGTCKARNSCKLWFSVILFWYWENEVSQITGEMLTYLRKFFLRNHLKYTLLYLNLPSGNKFLHTESLENQGLLTQWSSAWQQDWS